MAAANHPSPEPRSPRIPIARMRSLYRLDAVSQRLAKLPQQEHEGLRNAYQRMLEKGADRFQVKPAGLPAMDDLYHQLPNFHAALDDVKRQIALCQDSRDALEIMPSQWKGDRPVKVFETLVDGEYANPVMVVDEIDKARGEHAYDPLGALYGLMEHDTRRGLHRRVRRGAHRREPGDLSGHRQRRARHPRSDPEPHERLPGSGARPPGRDAIAIDDLPSGNARRSKIGFTH